MSGEGPQLPAQWQPLVSTEDGGPDQDPETIRAKGQRVTLGTLLEVLEFTILPVFSMHRDQIASLDARLTAIEPGGGKPKVTLRSWEAGRSYRVNDAVVVGGQMYVARLNHLRSDPATDVVGWKTLGSAALDARMRERELR